jgi:hypothetical protein
MWSLVFFLLNMKSILSAIKAAGIESHLSVALVFAIIFAPTIFIWIWVRKSSSDLLWKKSKDWTLYLLLVSIAFGWGLIILKVKYFR